jgi:hypothetical protein
MILINQAIVRDTQQCHYPLQMENFENRTCVGRNLMVNVQTTVNV